MMFGLYILYSLVQSILTVRYILEEKEHPVGAVLLFSIFAPLVTVGLLCGGFYFVVKWLVTYRPATKSKNG